MVRYYTRNEGSQNQNRREMLPSSNRDFIHISTTACSHPTVLPATPISRAGWERKQVTLIPFKSLHMFSTRIHISHLESNFLKDLGSLKNDIYFVKYCIRSDTFLPKCHLLQYTFTRHTDNQMLHLLLKLWFHLYHLNNTECHVCFTNCQFRLPK